MYLAGDIGGTKTLLAEFARTDEGMKQVRSATFPSRNYADFDTILTEFLQERSGPPLASACFGLAGTVVNSEAKLTNLPWLLKEKALGTLIGVPRVKLLNDLETTALGMLTLPASELAALNPDAMPTPSRAGNIAVIAAGTGLGEAMLYWDGSHYHPVASEGGHADFGPRNEREVELWLYLRTKFKGHVSYERVLSGPGFVNIYEFLRDHGYYEEPSWLGEKIRAGNANAVISEHGLESESQVPLCAETVGMFASIYGAEAGNAALRCVAVGGVFIGGGIAPKLLPALKSPRFLEGFTDKGRFTKFLRGIEISVSLNPTASLEGAGHYAEQL